MKRNRKGASHRRNYFEVINKDQDVRIQSCPIELKVIQAGEPATDKYLAELRAQLGQTGTCDVASLNNNGFNEDCPVLIRRTGRIVSNKCSSAKYRVVHKLGRITFEREFQDCAFFEMIPVG